MQLARRRNARFVIVPPSLAARCAGQPDLVLRLLVREVRDGLDGVGEGACWQCDLDSLEVLRLQLHHESVVSSLVTPKVQNERDAPLPGP